MTGVQSTLESRRIYILFQQRITSAGVTATEQMNQSELRGPPSVSAIPLGVIYYISSIPDIYIKIHNHRTITVRK